MFPETEWNGGLQGVGGERGEQEAAVDGHRPGGLKRCVAGCWQQLCHHVTALSATELKMVKIGILFFAFLDTESHTVQAGLDFSK